MQFFKIFAMAKIHRIGHDHQAPFQVVALVVVLIVVVQGHEAKTNYHMANIPQTTNILTDS